MLNPNALKKKVTVNDFITLIRTYSANQIEDCGHALKEHPGI